jgi:hypothetical protein
LGIARTLKARGRKHKSQPRRRANNEKMVIVGGNRDLAMAYAVHMTTWMAAKGALGRYLAAT